MQDDKENSTPVSSSKGNPFCSVKGPKAQVKKSHFDVTTLTKEEKGYYEFLCRVAEVKRWIEEVTQQSLPSELELCVGDGLRNGVYLAQVTQRINHDLAPTIHPAGDKLQFKHTQNINAFFSLVDHVGMPNSFRFELQDLYNKKSLPQVFETIYILITIINKKWPTKTPSLQTLSGQLNFSKDDLKSCQRAWPRIRDFQSLSISPVASPIAKPKNSTCGSGLIDDFKTFEVFSGNSAHISHTPTKEHKQLKTVTLAPPCDNESSIDMSSPGKTDTEFTSLTMPSFKPLDENLLSRTSHLEYSPLKSTSLSYYSPSISRYLTCDTDFYIRRSQAREKDLDYCNSFDYGPIEYSPRRKEKMTESEFLETVLKIQGRCRAVNLRFDLQIQRNITRLFEREVYLLQSFVRGSMLRKRSEVNIILKFNGVQLSLLTSIQAIIKAVVSRRKLDFLRMKCLRQEDRIEKLQRFSRAVIARRTTNTQLNNIALSDAPLRSLQALLSGIIRRSKLCDNSLCPGRDTRSIKNLQAMCRGYFIRKFHRNVIDILEFESSNQLIDLQSIAKGHVARSSLKKLISSLEDQNYAIEKLSSTLQGSKTRQSIARFFQKDSIDFSSLSIFQASLRGVLVRYTLDLVDDYVEYNRSVDLQARLRGYLVRFALAERSSMFSRNSRSLLIIQSKIRMFLQRCSYLELMQSPNPSLSCVRKFAHLLNNSGTIEDIQDKLEGYQAQLDAENLRKEKQEKEIRRQIDLKEVLQKNELTVEIPDHVANMDVPKNRYPSFEKLFYLLQVDPSYWKVMYKKYPEFVKDNVYCCFSTMNQRMGGRERKYFIRLIAEILQYEISQTDSLKVFLGKENQVWRHLLKDFLRREYPELIDLFVPLLRYIGGRNVTFESDPYVIYKTIHNKEPMSRSTAIEDHETEIQFIKNLRDTWHCVEMVAELLTRSISEFPLEIRFLSTKIFSFAADENAGEKETLRAISIILLKCVVFEYLENRSYYGYQEEYSRQFEAKLNTIMDSLFTVFSLDQFSGYNDPLNQYASEMKSQIKILLLNTLLDPEYEQSGDRLIYQDMISKIPRLEIFTEKLLKINTKFQECLSYFPDEDVIHDILRSRTDGNPLPKTGRVVLELSPAVYRFLICDDRMRKVYDQVKRAFVYMMQVEEISTNLYELAVSCVLPDDEPVFDQLLNSNPRIKTDPIIGSLDPPAYFNLKNSTLKKLHELESMGLVNPSNNKLQNFLNDIANTIKNPHYAVNYVTQELDITHRTLENISKINHDLNVALNLLKKSNDQSIRAIQDTQKYAPIHKGPLGNLKGAYKKAQSKRGFEMEGLKFKWTTRQLYEKGVIKSIEGEKLAEQKVKVFGSSGPKFPDITFKISTLDGGKFGIQLLDRRKGPEKRHSDLVDSFTMKDLLNTQVGSKVEAWQLFSGKVSLDTSALLSLIVATFHKREAL